MSLRKRKKQKANSLLPVLINPGPAPVAVNPFVKETGPEVIQGRRGGKPYSVAMCGAGTKPLIPKFFGPLQRGCSNVPPPSMVGCCTDIAAYGSHDKTILSVTDSTGSMHHVDITDMTPGQIEAVVKMYSSIRDEVSEMTPEMMDNLKSRTRYSHKGYINTLSTSLTDDQKKRLLMGDWHPEK